MALVQREEQTNKKLEGKKSMWHWYKEKEKKKEKRKKRGPHIWGPMMFDQPNVFYFT